MSPSGGISSTLLLPLNIICFSAVSHSWVTVAYNDLSQSVVENYSDCCILGIGSFPFFIASHILLLHVVPLFYLWFTYISFSISSLSSCNSHSCVLFVSLIQKKQPCFLPQITCSSKKIKPNASFLSSLVYHLGLSLFISHPFSLVSPVFMSSHLKSTAVSSVTWKNLNLPAAAKPRVLFQIVSQLTSVFRNQRQMSQNYRKRSN